VAADLKIAVVIAVVVDVLIFVVVVAGNVPAGGDEVTALVVPDGEGRGQQQRGFRGVGGAAVGAAAADAVDPGHAGVGGQDEVVDGEVLEPVEFEFGQADILQIQRARAELLQQSLALDGFV